MTEEEALTIIKQACASVVGNLEVHDKIQRALKVVEDNLLKSEE